MNNKPLPLGGCILLALLALGMGIAGGVLFDSIPLDSLSLPEVSVASEPPEVGKPAPSFSLENLSGDTRELADYAGYPVLLNFWASWCGPCVMEMPVIEYAYIHHYKEVIFLAVNVGENRTTVADFIENERLSVPVLLDERQDAAKTYSLQAYPTTFFIDAQGVIQAIQVGMMDTAILNDGLAAIGVAP